MMRLEKNNLVVFFKPLAHIQWGCIPIHVIWQLGEGELMGEAGFKHITVTASEDEDVVIRAGLGADEAEGDARDGEAVAVENAADDEEAGIAGETAAESEERNGGSTASKAAEEAKAYRPTTMDDLDSGPMPAAQKAVIIAAVVCIIGALVYYFAFMR